jgi:hypothetical protein
VRVTYQLRSTDESGVPTIIIEAATITGAEENLVLIDETGKVQATIDLVNTERKEIKREP